MGFDFGSLDVGSSNGGGTTDNTDNVPDSSGGFDMGDLLKPTPQPPQQNQSSSQQLPPATPTPPQNDGSAFGIPYLGIIGNFIKGMAQGAGQILGPKEIVSLAQPISGVNSIKLPGLGKVTSYQNDAIQALQKLAPNASLAQKLEVGAGSVLKPVVDIGSLLVGGPESEGVAEGGSTLLKSMLTGGKIGLAQGAVQGLTGGESPTGVLGSTAIGGVQGTAAGVGGHVISGVLGKVLGLRGAPTEESPEETPQQSQNSPQRPATTMEDVRTNQNPIVALKPPEINPTAPLVQDIKPPESAPTTGGATGQMSPNPADIIQTLSEERKAGSQPTPPIPSAAQPKTGNIDDMINKSGFANVETAKKINVLGGNNEANAKASFDYETGTGTIVKTPNATPETMAHEFTHILNNKMENPTPGTSNASFTSKLDQFMSGQSKEAPASLDKYVRDNIGKGATENQIQIAIHETAQNIKNEMDTLGEDQKNSSEAFSVAASKILTDPNAHFQAPNLADFLHSQIETHSTGTPLETPEVEPNNSQSLPKQNPSSTQVSTPKTGTVTPLEQVGGAKTPITPETPQATPNLAPQGGTKSAEEIPDVIKETKKTIQVKTPTNITAGGATPKNGAPIKSESINLDKLNTTDDVKNMINQSSKANAEDINAQRRGTISNQQTKELATMTGLKTKDIINAKPGAIMNSENAYAARNLMLNAAQEVQDLAGKMSAENPAEADVSKFKQAVAKFQAIQQTLAGVRSEAGRLLQQFNMKASPEEYEMLQSVAKAIGENPTGVGVAEALKPMSMFENAVRALVDISTAGKFTAPTTIEAKGLGDFINTMVKTVSKGGSEVIRTVLPESISKWAGFSDVAQGETAAQIQGMKKAFPIATQDFFDDVKNIIKGETAENSEFSHSSNPTAGIDDKTSPVSSFLKRLGVSENIADKTSNYLTNSYQVLRAINNYAGKINYAGDLYAQALREAQVHEGLAGKALQDRVSEIIKDPSTVPGLQERLMGNVKKVTMTQANNLARGMQTIVDAVPMGLGKLAVPVTKMAANIPMEGMRMSPLGFIKPLMESFKGEATAETAQAYTKALLGSGAALGIYSLAINGKITGSSPPQGEPMESIQIGGNWYNYMKALGPVGQLISNTANIAHDMKAGNNLPVTVGNIMLHGAKTFTDQPMISEVSDLVNAVSNASSVTSGGLGYYSNKVISSLVTGNISNWLKYVAKAGDTSVRDTSNITNSVKNSIPGLRETLPEKIGTNGQPIPQSGSPLEKFLSPFPSQPVDNSKLTKVLQNSNFQLSNKSLSSINGVKLNPESKSEYQEAVGTLRNTMLSNLVSHPEFDKTPQAEQDKLLQVFSSGARSIIDGKIMAKMGATFAQEKTMTKPEQKQFNIDIQGKVAEVIKEMGK